MAWPASREGICHEEIAAQRLQGMRNGDQPPQPGLPSMRASVGLGPGNLVVGIVRPTASCRLPCVPLVWNESVQLSAEAKQPCSEDSEKWWKEY